LPWHAALGPGGNALRALKSPLTLPVIRSFRNTAAGCRAHSSRQRFRSSEC
jgi:hypothetical protein